MSDASAAPASQCICFISIRGPGHCVMGTLADDRAHSQACSVPLTGADCGNLATYICTAYTGEKPGACYKTPDFLPCPGAPVGASSLSLD
jgi:hypothetical protein